MRLVFLFFLCIGHTIAFCQSFVQTKNRSLFYHNKEYKFIGTNYWYGGYLPVNEKGKKRLKNELNSLSKHGIKNLRVFFCGEGDSSYPYRIYPSVQSRPGNFNLKILNAFDYFLYEVRKRNMKVVVVLNNNWEWSGGFGQYIEWNRNSNPILPKTLNWDWDQYCEYISQFYTCDSCQTLYKAWLKKIILRKNTVSNIYYRDDPAIMSWELANEPRPMKDESKLFYKDWIQKSSQYIKSIDKNHMVTTGVEGAISTRLDTILLEECHRFPSIDYLTIHLWPKTWLWYDGKPENSVTEESLNKTKEYIELHARIANRINKPIIIEEFGLHRDMNSFLPSSTIQNRNLYFSYVLDQGLKHGYIGFNFWGAYAHRDPLLKNDFWRQGISYGADPPQEEQGMYGVYTSDSSTWKLIHRYSKIMLK